MKLVVHWCREPVAFVANGAKVTQTFFKHPIVWRIDLWPQGWKQESYIAVGYGNIIYQKHIALYFLFEAAASDCRIGTVVFMIARQPIGAFEIFGNESEEIIVIFLEGKGYDVTGEE